MPGDPGVRPSYAAIISHPISTIDPVLASVTADVMSSHLAPKTQRNYNSAVKSYLSFCSVRSLQPWPCDPIWVCAWITQTTMHVSVRSMKVYLAALRSAQIDHGHEWTLSGDVQVARALRAAKRLYGMSGKALKIPISLSTLMMMCRQLPGWPVPERMSHDDRVFVCSSCIAILGFLRGGEFLYSPSTSRPLLRHMDVSVSDEGGMSSVLVNIQRPKARWWLLNSAVSCFDPGPGCLVNPTTWLRKYRTLSTVPLYQRSAAFKLSSGAVLSKRWMLTRCTHLLARAGISVVDATGNPVPIRASSWRAGGVQSAKDAGVSDAMIQTMGRWSSAAWFNYHFSTRRDLQRAAGSMWRHAGSSRSLVVGSFSPAAVFSDAI